MKIGIELNGIVRDLNYQLLKYYKKDIKPDFEEDSISLNKTTIVKDLPFDDEKSRGEFVFIDYPYEIFGCARVTERNLSNTINNWLIDLYDANMENEAEFFSLGENDLSVPSTYYFLSKIATRVRNVWFPKNIKDVWGEYDVIITTNEEIVKSKPSDKVVVLILKDDNASVEKKSDFSYKKLSTALKDNLFMHQTNAAAIPQNTSFWNKILKFFNH